MKYKVHILPQAWENLQNIEDWYILQFNNNLALLHVQHGEVLFLFLP